MLFAVCGCLFLQPGRSSALFPGVYSDFSKMPSREMGVFHVWVKEQTEDKEIEISLADGES